MRDKFVRNRTVKGSKNGRATLNEEQVMRIVEDGRTYQEIADEYNVCRDTIKNIMTGKNWSHVTGIKRKKRRK
jgi:DNA-binding NarL/FixJ family response regulator